MSEYGLALAAGWPDDLGLLALVSALTRAHDNDSSLAYGCAVPCQCLTLHKRSEMISKRVFVAAFLGSVLVLILAACDGGAAPTATPTQVPATSTPTGALTPAPTPTAARTPTPKPTPTVEPLIQPTLVTVPTIQVPLPIDSTTPTSAPTPTATPITPTITLPSGIPTQQPPPTPLPVEEKPAEAARGLQIVLKDVGLPEVKYLQPTLSEIQLQNEAGSWTTIWLSSPEGRTVKLTTDGAELVLDTVSVEAGTYVGTRLLVSTIDVEVDINRDGDTLDTNVQIILTEEEFNSLPPKDKPSPPAAPQPPAKPQAPTGGGGGGRGQQAPPEPQAPSPPYKIVNGIVYTGDYLDEKHTVILNHYIVPIFESKFVYDGSGGKIVYDFTLHSLLPKAQQISVDVVLQQ